MWWRNRKAISFIVGVVILVQLVYWIGLSTISDTTVGLLVFCSVSISVLSSLAIFTFGADLDFSTGRTAFPQRFFTLPVGSLKISLIPVFAMVVAIAWCWIPAALLMLHNISGNANAIDIDATFASLFIALPWLAMSAVGCWLQAIAWWPFRSAWHRLGVIVVLVVSVVALFVYGIDAMQSKDFQTPRLLILLTALFGFSAAVVSVFKARRLSWRSEASARDFSLVASDDDSSFRKLASFDQLELETSEDSLLWRDWRQVFRVPSLLMMFFAAPFAFAVFLIPLLAHTYSAETLEPDASDSYSIAIYALLQMITILIPLIMFVPPFILLMTSPMLGKSSYWKREFAFSAFLGGLPVSDDQFLVSRIKSVLRSSFQAWSVALFALALWAIPNSIRQPFSQMIAANGADDIWPYFAVCFILGSLYLSLAAPWPGMAVGLFGRGKLGTTFAFALMLLFLIGSSVAYSVVEAMTEEAGIDFGKLLANWTPTILSTLLLLKALLAIFASWALIRRDLVDWRVACTIAGFLLLACVAVTGFFVVMLHQTDSFSRKSLYTIASLIVLLFPFSAFPFARLAIDANRHR
jgi:hypothetical protein